MPVRKCTVAIVDNDPRLLESLGDLLESAGYSARLFQSAEALLEDKILLSELDCLVTDIGMPGIDGPELRKLVKQVQPQLRVIFITGRHELADAQWAVDQGTLILRKPFDAPALLTAVEQSSSSVNESE